MKIITLPNGFFQVNTYILYKENTCIIIDPGSGTKQILDIINKHSLKPQAIIATHGHIDHIEGAFASEKKFNIPFYISNEDLPLFDKLSMQANLLGLSVPDKPQNIIKLPSDEKLTIEEFEFFVLHTPGHSQGSVSLLIQNNLFSGDTLFHNSIGRTDLFGGNFSTIIQSIKTKLFVLDPQTIVYSGHGDLTTIKNEIDSNPFFRD